VISPLGRNREEFLTGLREGYDGSGPVTRFEHDSFPVRRVCEVKNFHLEFSPDPYIQFGLKAAEEAILDSGVKIEELDPYRFGLVASSSKGGMTSLERGEIQDFSPDRLNYYLAKKFRASGPMKCVVAACATGTYSIIEGARWIEQGDADFVLAGASDASITPLMLAGYFQMGVYSKNGMCPYDARRSGFLIGEGAGMVALESKAHAKARGARIYGEIAGYAFSTDSFRATAFNPDSDALSRLLKDVLRKSDFAVSELDYFNTHGTSTWDGDRYETDQIKKAFGKAAYGISYSSTKSMVGHMLGASGAVELIACLLAMQEGFIPPTIHLEQPDPACDLDYTPHQSRQKKVDSACSISMGFGGHLGALLIQK